MAAAVNWGSFKRGLGLLEIEMRRFLAGPSAHNKWLLQ